MAGIYLHIPFCRKACTYCDFHFSTNPAQMDALVAAMVKELEFWAPEWRDEQIETVYFGGGTPSLLKAGHLDQLFHALYSNFSISKQAEISFEVNPEDVTPQQIQLWKSFGINRLSIGIQAFQEDVLSWMNRAHSSKQALESVEISHNNGISNISIDLIYGIPQLDHKKWQQNLELAASLPISHVSCYALTVENKTVLDKWVQTEKVAMPDDEMVNEQFDMLSSFFENRGFEHYEISNLGKPGLHSQHNSNYWNRVPYLGIGPSAHSFRGDKRWFNVRSNALYIKKIADKELHYEEEVLSATDVYNETIMTQLRLATGLNASHLQIGELNQKFILSNNALNKLYNEQLVYLDDSNIKLTKKGRHFADGVAARLFR